jgi:DNA-binding NtrC family response regulator
MSSANHLASTGCRILVVEDEYLVADSTSTMLKDLGYDVVGPVPSPEAIKAIASEKLDAVLLDANLRGTSSASIAGELAARALPFIVVTGCGDLMLAAAAPQAAPRVNKPFTSTDLAAILAKTVTP